MNIKLDRICWQREIKFYTPQNSVSLQLSINTLVAKYQIAQMTCLILLNCKKYFLMSTKNIGCNYYIYQSSKAENLMIKHFPETNINQTLVF